MATLRELVQNQTKDEARLAQAKRGSAEYKKIQDRINKRQELIQQADGTREFAGRPILPETTDPSLQNLTIDKPGAIPPPTGDTLVFGGQNYSVADLTKLIESNIGLKNFDSSVNGPAYALGILRATRPDLAAKYVDRSVPGPGGRGVPGYGVIIYKAGEEPPEEQDAFSPIVPGKEVVPNTAVTVGKSLAEIQKDLEKTETANNASAQLKVFLKSLFFDQEDAFIDEIVKSAYPDFISGLDSDTIILKMQDYTNPNSVFSRRFSGNVDLVKKGIEPLNAETYLAQEKAYREALVTRGLGELANRSTFGQLVGNQVSAFELEDRVAKVFDIYDSADTGLKSELQTTLKLDPLSTRTSVAKALLLGDKGATELQRQIRTAEVGTEARSRGLDVSAASELAGMGVTREQARAGFEQIALTQPRLTQLSEMYTSTTPDASGLQRELEREQFQGMQSQRRRRLTEQEQSAFMGQSGTAGSTSLGRRRTGSY
jgi:hypothetical protein